MASSCVTVVGVADTVVVGVAWVVSSTDAVSSTSRGTFASVCVSVGGVLCTSWVGVAPRVGVVVADVADVDVVAVAASVSVVVGVGVGVGVVDVDVTPCASVIVSVPSPSLMCQPICACSARLRSMRLPVSTMCGAARARRVAHCGDSRPVMEVHPPYSCRELSPL